MHIETICDYIMNIITQDDFCLVSVKNISQKILIVSCLKTGDIFMGYPVNEIAMQVGKLKFNGPIIPNEFHKHIKKENGKPYSIAIIILAEIVYWYRPVEIYDLKTEKLIGYQRKFESDILQKSYAELEAKFEYTRDQIRDAIIFLEGKGLIDREFRDIKVGRYSVNTVMYLRLNFSKLSEILPLETVGLLVINNNKEDEESHPIINGAKNVEENPVKINQGKDCLSTPSIDSCKWTKKFSEEEKKLFEQLINIKPSVGEKIKQDDASWWIKHFGIEKVNCALSVYKKRINRAQNDSGIPMPKSAGAYIRKILNENEQANKKSEIEKSEAKIFPPIFGNSDEGVRKFPNPNTQTTTKNSSNVFKVTDWSVTFSIEEKKYFDFLLKIVPEKGNSIRPDAATYWIRKFGIEKIKVALKVYWQQVERAKKTPNVPMPNSIGAYVRTALNEGTKPCQEQDKRNKAFAEKFKATHSWCELTITEKYCRMEGVGKEWYYFLPEEMFRESLLNAYSNFGEIQNRWVI